MENLEFLSVKKVVVQCNQMIKGNFLDLAKKIESLMNEMAKTKPVFDYVTSSLEDFDKNGAIEKAFSYDEKTGKPRIELPSDDTKKFALITTLLSEMIEPDFKLTQFLNTYFSNNSLTATRNFLDVILKLYRDLLCKHFAISNDLTQEELEIEMKAIEQTNEKPMAAQTQIKTENTVTKQTYIVEELPYLDEFIEIISINVTQILSTLKFEKKRNERLEDIEFVCNAILRACEIRDLMTINGLFIGLEYIAKKYKPIKHLMQDTATAIHVYYESLEVNEQYDAQYEEFDEEDEYDEDHQEDFDEE